MAGDWSGDCISRVLGLCRLPVPAEAARPRRHVPGDRWFTDETYLKVAGQWTYLYRAIDQYGQVIDVLLSDRRDLAAARSFFTRALRAGTAPAEVTTDRASVYPRVLDELVPSALHIVVQNLRRGHYDIATEAPTVTRSASPSTTSHSRSEPACLEIMLRRAQGRHNATVPSEKV